MPKLTAKPQVTVAATLLLSESEIRLLNKLAGFGSGLTRIIREHVTRDIGEKELDLFLSQIQEETCPILRQLDRAKQAFDEGAFRR
jgi:hypothetical protein